MPDLGSTRTNTTRHIPTLTPYVRREFPFGSDKLSRPLPSKYVDMCVSVLFRLQRMRLQHGRIGIVPSI